MASRRFDRHPQHLAPRVRHQPHDRWPGTAQPCGRANSDGNDPSWSRAEPLKPPESGSEPEKRAALVARLGGGRDPW